MKPLATLLVVAAAFGSPALAASPLFVTPDEPGIEGAGGTTLLPWEVYRYDAAGPSYTTVLSVPGQPFLDGIHKLDAAGGWMLSVRTPSSLGGALTSDAMPSDVIRLLAGTYSIVFCSAAIGIGAGTNVDALFVEGGDGGDLILSFDVPVELPPVGGVTYEPSDLIRFVRTGPTCSGWSVAAANPYFDASAAGAGIPISDNTRGADRASAGILLAIDVPSDLAPSAGPFVTYTPGVVASWSSPTFDDFEVLAGWPAGTIVDGLSCVGNPGKVDKLAVTKAAAPAGDLLLSWTASCSSGALDYAIYQGSIGVWYSHTLIDCNDAGGDRTEQVTPAAASSYYLVVPTNTKGEGTYGTRSSGVQRPVGAAQCAAPQLVTACP